MAWGSVIRRVRPTPYSLVLFAVLLACYAALYFLWTIQSPAYASIMSFLGVRPWSSPFLDAIGVLSWGDCHVAGVDVLRTNPCDPLHRLFNYSPLLLDLPLHWIGRKNVVAASMTMDIVFLAAMTGVLRPDSLRALVISLIAGLSPAVVLGMERANLDLLVVTLIAAGALLGIRGGSYRLGSYVLYFAAGTLKFYPFVLLGLLIRERRAVFLTCSLVAGLLLIVLGTHYWDDLVRVRRLIPPPNYYATEMFGAVLLPFRHLYRRSGAAFAVVLLCLLVAAAIGLERKLQPLISKATWGRPSMQLLAVGTILSLGWFFGGASYAYRATTLLFVIPALLELPSEAESRGVRLILNGTLWAVLFCLWQGLFGPAAALAGGPIHLSNLFLFVYFNLRDLVWWAVMCVFAALLAAFIRQSRMWEEFRSGLIRARVLMVARREEVP